MLLLLFLELLSWVFTEFQVPTFHAHIDVLDGSFNPMFFYFFLFFFYILYFYLGFECVSDLGSAPSSSIL